MMPKITFSQRQACMSRARVLMCLILVMSENHLNLFFIYDHDIHLYSKLILLTTQKDIYDPLSDAECLLVRVSTVLPVKVIMIIRSEDGA